MRAATCARASSRAADVSASTAACASATRRCGVLARRGELTLRLLPRGRDLCAARHAWPQPARSASSRAADTSAAAVARAAATRSSNDASCAAASLARGRRRRPSGDQLVLKLVEDRGRLGLGVLQPPPQRVGLGGGRRVGLAQLRPQRVGLGRRRRLRLLQPRAQALGLRGGHLGRVGRRAAQPLALVRRLLLEARQPRLDLDNPLVCRALDRRQALAQARRLGLARRLDDREPLVQRRELVGGGALGLLQPRAQRLRFGRRLGLRRRQPLTDRGRLSRRAAGALLGVGEPVAQVVGVGLQRLLGALGVGLGGAQRGLQRQRLLRPRRLGRLQLRPQRLGLARRRVAILGRRRQPPAQRSGLFGARPRLGQLGLDARQARGRLLGQRRALAGGGRRDAQLLQLGARRLGARLASRRAVSSASMRRRASRSSEESSAARWADSSALSRAACWASASAARRAARSSRTRVVRSSARRAAASARWASASVSASFCSSAWMRCSACSARRCAVPALSSAWERSSSIVSARSRSSEQLGGARLGDLPRLVDRGQSRLSSPGGAARALGDLLGGSDLALALLQRTACLVGDLDGLARLLGGPRRALAVLTGALLLGSGTLTGAHALFGEGVDGAGSGGLGVGGELGDPRRLVGRLLGDRVRLGRPALGVLARGALLGQPRVQRGDVRRARELADVERRRRLLGGAHQPSQPPRPRSGSGRPEPEAAPRPRPPAAAPPAPVARRAPSAAADP